MQQGFQVRDRLGQEFIVRRDKDKRRIARGQEVTLWELTHLPPLCDTALVDIVTYGELFPLCPGPRLHCPNSPATAAVDAHLDIRILQLDGTPADTEEIHD